MEVQQHAVVDGEAVGYRQLELVVAPDECTEPELLRDEGALFTLTNMPKDSEKSCSTRSWKNSARPASAPSSPRNATAELAPQLLGLALARALRAISSRFDRSTHRIRYCELAAAAAPPPAPAPRRVRRGRIDRGGHLLHGVLLLDGRHRRLHGALARGVLRLRASTRSTSRFVSGRSEAVPRRSLRRRRRSRAAEEELEVVEEQALDDRGGWLGSPGAPA